MVRSPPIVAVSPPPKVHVPALSSPFVTASVVPSSRFSVVPASIVNRSAAPEVEIVADPVSISAGIVEVGAEPKLQSVVAFRFQSPMLFQRSVTINPAPVSSNAVPLLSTPPEKVVPNKSPLASAIKPPCGYAPLLSLKLTTVVGVLA